MVALGVSVARPRKLKISPVISTVYLTLLHGIGLFDALVIVMIIPEMAKWRNHRDRNALIPSNSYIFGEKKMASEITPLGKLDDHPRIG